MDSSLAHTNESTESDTAHGEDVSPAYGIEMDVDSGQLAIDATPLNSMTPEPARPQLEDCSIDPYIGMEFGTVEDAWMFYNAYARRIGFNTRISVYQRSRRDGSITARQFVCAREGFRTPRRKRGNEGGSETQARRTRAVTRVGCKAMIRVKKQDNGQWIVSRLETAHNHELEVQSRAHSLRSLRLLSESGKNFGGTRATRYIKPAQLTYNRVDKVCTVGRGTKSIIDYLKRMQAEDNSFFLAVQLDTGNALWADARSRMAYRNFGDVVIFDTSYKMSPYQVPLVSFTGVNHHCQPVLFACGILVDDSESSLVWLFKMMLSAMLEHHPISIVSEHNRVIESAIAQVFPQARNRLCKWHIFKETQDRLSHVFLASPSFQEELHKCINMVDTIGEFESCWATLISRFGLKDNEWLQSLYSCRNKWVPVYLRNTFFAEFSSTEYCENKTPYFDDFINAQIDSQTFIQQYEKALDNRYEKEVQADFDTIYSLPVMKTSSPIEKQAAEAYTRKIFMKFQEQLMEASSCTANRIDEDGDYSTYRVAKFDEENKAYTVLLNATETKATCSCQMFEYTGILCRHILTVFGATNICTLSSHYILKRWTKNAKDEGFSKVKSEVVSDEVNTQSQSNFQDAQQSLTWRYNSLCHEALKYAENGSTSIDIFVVAMRALQEAVNKVNMAKSNVGQAGQPGVLRNGIQASDEKDLQEPRISRESGGKGSNEDRSVTSYQMKWAITPQEMKGTSTSQQEALFSQQPCRFLLITPGLSNESGSSNLPTATMPNGQALCTQADNPKLVHCTQSMNTPFPFQLLPSTISTGTLDGNGPVLVSLPTEGITKGDAKPGGIPSQPSQGWNIVGLAQANTNSGSSANVASLCSSEAQLLAVPVAFLVPTMGNLPAPSSRSPTNCSTPLGSQEVPKPVASAEAGRPTAAQESPTHVKEQMGSSMAPMNPIRAAAIAAGARIASPSVAASLMKAAQSKNAIHIKAEGGSLVRSMSGGGGETLAADLWSTGQMSTLGGGNNGSIENACTALTKDWTPAGCVKGNNQSPEERRVDFMDSDDDEDTDHVHLSGDQIVDRVAE